jgi:hypothetical protein
MWKKLNIPGPPTFINEFGQIKESITVKNGKIVRDLIVPHVRTGGYWGFTRTVDGRQRTYLVHRLVAKHFVKNVEKYRYVKFIDGNRDHTNSTNLTWVRKSRRIKLSQRDADFIRLRLSQGVSAKRLAEQFNVAFSHIYMIGRGERWASRSRRKRK